MKETNMEPKAPYKYDNWYIPQRMMDGINRYLDYGIIPGSFLQAVICNDLMEAASRADTENLNNLPAFMAFFYHHTPSGCWGSQKKMLAWYERGGLTCKP